MGIDITSVRINLKDGDDKLKAFASIVINDCFIVKGLKVINGTRGYFVSMPNRKQQQGENINYVDVAHPLNNETREMIEKTVLDNYEKALSERTDS